MTRFWIPHLPAVALWPAVWVLATVAATARADRVEMADGRVLEGRFALLPGVAVDPTAEKSQAAGTPILMCDDELTRIMVSKRRVAKTEPAPVDFGLEKIRIPQRVPEKGRRVAGMGAAIETTPFDEFGRRILSLSTAGGRVDVVQGITEITPRWTRIEGVVTENPVLLDMRLATSALPRDVLKRVIEQHIDRTNADHRLRVVRLLIQAERYEDARSELDEVLKDFSSLAELNRERKRISELAARRILDEIRMRGRVGQDRLALRLLENFPTADVGGELLEEVREERDRYRDRQEKARTLVAGLRARVAGLEDAQEQAAAAAVADEIESQLSFGTFERLATFERLGADPALPAARAVALAINGWLQGPASGDDNLKVALSAVRLRETLRDYLRSADAPAREGQLERMRGEEAFSAATLAAIARHMRPPLDPPPPTAPGLYTLEVPGLPGAGTARCLVQLPPEYDPLRGYPTIVSLHAAWTTPEQQLEWWAGRAAADGTRLGQATRHGAIVIAPAWGREHQTAYEYSAREHAIVLAALREACQRFAIDTDRVFLSGHSMGGDAAWDIGLAHPDLWAGVIPISAAADRYVHHYWRNAAALPLYFVGGELDRGTLQRNAVDLDRYFLKGYDATYVEYRGRGHDHFAEELLRIFDWMGRKRRTAPQEIEAVSMRPWDRFFWWLEFAEAPPKTVTLPGNWPPAKGAGPLEIEGQVTPGNTMAARCGGRGVRLWLGPDSVDMTRPVTVTLSGERLFKGRVVPDERVLLEDLRRRGDRQHPFWAVVEGR
jgi:predicted esterase